MTRALRLAIAFAAILCTPMCWLVPAGAASSVQITLNSPSAKAGDPEVFTITRLSGGTGIYVLFQTADGSAHAGADYVTTKQLVYLKGGQKTATVAVPTIVNGSASGTLTFKASAAVGTVGVSATGSIVEPAAPPPPVTWTKCADEGGTCSIVGTANVRFGLGTVYSLPIRVTGSIACNNSQSWGDPLVGTPKICQTDGTPAAAPPPATQTCPDGSVVSASSTCPAAPPSATTWVGAPLQDGSFARVKANDSDWDGTGPGTGRKLVPGEIVVVYFNGWGHDADGTASFAIYALADGSSGRAKAADLEGVAPVGAAPALPAGWWIPGLVTATKTCTDPRQGHEGQFGVTQGGVYRAAMLAGSHTALAVGQAGVAGTMWQVFASGDQSHTASTVVMGDCLVGSQ